MPRDVRQEQTTSKQHFIIRHHLNPFGPVLFILGAFAVDIVKYWWEEIQQDKRCNGLIIQRHDLLGIADKMTDL